MAIYIFLSGTTITSPRWLSLLVWREERDCNTTAKIIHTDRKIKIERGKKSQIKNKERRVTQELINVEILRPWGQWTPSTAMAESHHCDWSPPLRLQAPPTTTLTKKLRCSESVHVSNGPRLVAGNDDASKAHKPHFILKYWLHINVHTCLVATHKTQITGLSHAPPGCLFTTSINLFGLPLSVLTGKSSLVAGDETNLVCCSHWRSSFMSW